MRLLALALLLGAAVPAADAAELLITVENIRSASGHIRIAVCTSAAEWPDKSSRDHDQKQPARRGSVTFRYELPPGDYAATTYHDENDNGRFDTNFLGLPEEGYGFSNNVRPFLAAPSFDAARFHLPPEGASIVIRMMY